MQTHLKKLYPLGVLLLLNVVAFGQKSSLSLKHIVHRPVPGFTKSARLVKADAKGGTLDFDVSYTIGGNLCTETYRVQWKFDRDMTFLEYSNAPTRYDFEVQTSTINGRCGQIYPWRNPFVVVVANDVSSSMVLDEQGYDEVSMAKGISGGTGDRLFFRDDEWVRFNQARQGFLRSSFLTKYDENSYGKYSWFKFTIIGNSNYEDEKASFQYELVYIYDVNGAPPYQNVNTLTLGTPILSVGIGGAQARRGVNIVVPGELAANSGKQFHIEAHFEDAAGNKVRGNPGMPQYSNNQGFAMAVSPLYIVPPNAYRLEQLSLWMPFAGFNTKQSQIYTYVELWIDGRVAARSPRRPVQF